MKGLKESLASWRKLGLVELQEELKQLTEQNFKLKLQLAVGDLKEVHNIKQTRRNIARIMSLLSAKQQKG
jgi:large subunit ribosomal protein L29